MDHFFKGVWGSFGNGDGQFNSPTGIVVDSDGNVFVIDSQNVRIQKFSSKGIFLDKWRSPSTGDDQFDFINDITIDSNNDIYVTDIGNRVIKFSQTGDFIRKWGSTGSGDGQFYGPNGIAVESDDDIYVTDTISNRIQKFTRLVILLHHGEQLVMVNLEIRQR